MAKSLKDQIQNIQDLDRTVVSVPEWNDIEVEIRGLTAKGREAWEDTVYETVEVKQDDGTVDYDVQVKKGNIRAEMLVRCLYDPETGERIYADEEADLLGEKSSKVLLRLYPIARRLSGMDAESLDNEVKNSGGAPPDISPTN